MFQWEPRDLEELAHVQLLLAADVVYDDDLTKAFLTCSRQLMDHASANSGGCCFSQGHAFAAI